MTYARVIIAGTVLFAGLWWWGRRRRLQEQESFPKKWRKVGELVDIFTYPVKSLGPVRLNSAICTKLGLKSDWLRDRSLMVVDLDGKCVTARHHPGMIKVTPSFDDSVVTLHAPGMDSSVPVDLSQMKQKCTSRAFIWDDEVTVRDCGDEIALWLSQCVLNEDSGLRLVYYPLDTTMRPVSKKNTNFPLVRAEDSGAFPDETSFSMQNLSSVEALNNHLESPVSDRNFRMNFSVKGAKPFEEDLWDWIKIGDVVFRNLMPCVRCLFTTIDPDTAVKNPKLEPLKTLRKHRKVDDPVYKPIVHDSPLMGIHLGLRSIPGSVRVGDSVYVNEETQQYSLVNQTNKLTLPG